MTRKTCARVLGLLFGACALQTACGSSGPADTSQTGGGRAGAVGGSVSSGGSATNSGSGGSWAAGGTGGNAMLMAGATSNGGSAGAVGSAAGAGGGAAGTGGSMAGGGLAGSGGGGAGAGGLSSTQFAVVTNRYDNDRSGANTQETLLNTTNVAAAGKFGLLFSRQYDGNPYAQPLYVGGLTIAGAKHNVVFVATSTNDVYAFDADDPAATMPYWHNQVAAPATITIGGSGGGPIGTTWCQDMHPFSGITGTPVIDLPSNRIYLVSQEGKAQGNTVIAPYMLKLHALDLSTGNEVGGGPMVIDATVNGTGPGSNGGKLKLDSWRQFNRAGLTLYNGVLYIALTSHCDESPYHGWLFGYDPSTLSQRSVFNTSPNKNGAAIWQSGVGVAANARGLFFSTSNGDHANDGSALGLSAVRVGFDNTLTDWFTPSNADALNGGDKDLTSGVLLIPGSNYLATAGKEGVVYLIDQTHMTHFNGTDQITQKVAAAGSDIHDLVFYDNNLYVWPDGSPLKMYPFANGKLDEGAVKTFNGYTPNHPGGIMTVSANGAVAGSAILWSTVLTLGDAWHHVAQGALLALDAKNPSQVLFDSSQSAANKLGNLAKFSPPTVASGKVYVTTFANEDATSPSYLRVYGLKN